MKTALRLTFLLVLVLGGARAATVQIIETDSLQMRTIPIPGGETTTLYVFTGSPVRMRVDGDLIIAERIEFDYTNRLMRIIGAGDVSYDDVSTKGRNYLLDMRSSELEFKDVFIFTEPLDVQGVQATRQPGQIDITGGAFSPCSRCQQDVQDYRFTAERMNLYPGDRLVAFDVTVYIRDLPSFFLPLMVVPLGPPDRQPRFEIQRGSASERAEVALDWPYVFGANALGTVSLRYFADVVPQQSGSWTENILGGTIQPGGNYFGGGFEHRFYTARGQGNLEFFYTPSFVDEFSEDGRTQDELNLSFGYETEENLEGLRPEILLERDDASNQRILNLTARLSDSYGGFDMSAVTQTYFDLDQRDENQTPSYAESEGALRTYAQVTAEQGDDLTLSVGPFSLSGLQLELGVYEDYANSSNASATSSPIFINNAPVIRSGRLLGGQTLTLEAFSPFSGASVSGSTSFLGQYYTTSNDNGELERLIDWDTSLGFDQTFEGGTFGLDYTRTLVEGETPFAFDSQTPSTNSNLAASFSYVPYDWLELSIEETYTFEDSRDTEEVGAGPLETRIELFNNLDWFSAAIEQRYDIEEGDPGLLGASTTFTTPEAALEGSLTLRGVVDLSHLPPGDRAAPDPTPVNESQYDVLAEASYDLYAGLDVSFGFDNNADPEDLDPYYGSSYGGSIFDSDSTGSEFQGEPRYKPLEVGLTVGSIDEGDGVPGLRASASRDINDGTMQRIAFEAEAQAGPLEFSAEQSFDFPDGDDSDFSDAGSSNSTFNLSYPDIIELEGVGFNLLPPSLFGLTFDPLETTSYGLSLTDLTLQDSEYPLYELLYETSYGPLNNFDASEGLGFLETELSARVNTPFGYLNTGLGPLGFGVGFSSTLAIADDLLPQTYLSSTDLTLKTDFFSTFALQGTLEYDALSDGSGGLSSQSLGFTDFGGTVRLWEDLYFSALLDDTWEFINPITTGTPDEQTTPYNFQPIFYLTLDRCCWAFYAAYNTQNGALTLTLGYPGSDTGLTGAFNTGLYLPRREFE